MVRLISGLGLIVFASTAFPFDLTIKDKTLVSLSGSVSWELQWDKVTGKDQGRPEWVNTFTFTPSISFFKIPIPLDFLFTLSSLESAIRQPFNKFNLHFRRPWLDFYLGDAYPSYSEYTLNGIRIRGGSIDLNSGIFRFGITYGETKRAVEASDTTDASYRQMLYGGRIGVGRSEGSYIDFIFLKAKDDPNSIEPPVTEIRYDGDTLVDSLETILPQENVVAGIKGGLSLAKGAVKIGGELSASALTRDSRSMPMSVPNYPEWANTIMEPKLSTSVDFAANVKVDISFSSTSFSGSYKYVGPGYNSLGSPYLTNDIQGFSLSASQGLWNNQVSLNASFDEAQDNLLGLKSATTTTLVASFNIFIAVGMLPYLSFGYNSYSLHNDDPNDSLRVDNITQSYTANTGTSFNLMGMEHSLNLSYSLQRYRDRSPFAWLSSNYDLSMWMFSFNTNFKIPLSLSWSFGLSQNRSEAGDYEDIYSGNVSLSYRMFGDKLSNSLDINFDETKGKGIENRRWGISLRSDYNLPVLGNLSGSIERIVYSDKIEPVENYQEFVVRVSFSRTF